MRWLSRAPGKGARASVSHRRPRYRRHGRPAGLRTRQCPRQGLARRRIHPDAHLRRTTSRDLEKLRRPRRQAEDPPRLHRPAVVHPNPQFPPVLQVLDGEDDRKLQGAMRPHQPVRVEDLAIGGPPAASAAGQHRGDAALVQPEILLRIGPDTAHDIGLAEHVARRRLGRWCGRPVAAGRQQRQQQRRHPGRRLPHPKLSESSPTASA